MNLQHDIIIVGAGLAVLRAAVECADRDVVSKLFSARSHSCGGISAGII